MSDIQLSEKFIAYIDILGYSALTKAAEAGAGFSFAELEEILRLLGTEENRKHLQQDGPTICPQAPRVRNDLDFQITQAWDSVVVTAEVSPAGIINLISHCFGTSIGLLAKGVMCRGYVARGMIHHDERRIFGSGHVDTAAKERSVSFYKEDADERGTPFIEVDREVIDYVSQQPDKCVKEMFGRMVLTHEGLSAIYPIKRLSHSFVIGGFGAPKFDPAKERARNNNLRQIIVKLKQKVTGFVSESDPSAVRKANHYLRALDAQLRVCDRTDQMIDDLCRPYGRRATKDLLPGLFR